MASLSPRRVKALLAVLFLFSLAMAGCTGGDDEEEDDPDVPQEDEEEQDPPILALAVDDAPEEMVLGDQSGMNITVSGDNATGSWLGIRWSMESTEGAANLTTDLFDGEQEVEGELEFPGTFNLSDWTPTVNGTFYLRANAQVDHMGNTTDYWSDEFVVEVLEEVEIGEFSADTTIEMQLGGQIQGFDPDPAQINVGESVTWTNSDAVAHTATHSDHWDTGDVEGGDDASITVRFNKAGTYSYTCTIHADMDGEVVVS